MTHPIDEAGSSPFLTTLFESLTNQRRRRTLAVLLEHRRPITETQLAAQVAATEDGRSTSDVPTDERDAILCDLRHVHLPKLTDAGLVERTDDGVVAVGRDHLRALAVHEALRNWTDDEPTDLDAVLTALADRRRRRILGTLDRDGPLERDDLVDYLVAVENATDDETRGRVQTSLYHVHLPKLEAAGLIECDEGTITSDEHPSLRAAWIEAGLPKTELDPSPGAESTEVPPLLQ